MSENDVLHWKGQINGPVGTPYEGGKFAIDIVLPADYPFVPPKVRVDQAPKVLGPHARFAPCVFLSDEVRY